MDLDKMLYWTKFIKLSFYNLSLYLQLKTLTRYIVHDC